MMKNLFDYATKELSQDAFLRWLFENGFDENCDNENIKRIARKLFDKLTNSSFVNNRVDDLKTVAQWKSIDISIWFKVDGKEHLIVIEDKTSSKEHNQLRKYDEEIKKHNEYWKTHFKGAKKYDIRYIDEGQIFKAFYKTDTIYDDERKRVEESEWKIIDIDDICECFGKEAKTDSQILDDYIVYANRLRKSKANIEKPKEHATLIDCTNWEAYFNNVIVPKLKEELDNNLKISVFKTRYSYACLCIEKEEKSPYLEIRSRDCLDGKMLTRILCYGIYSEDINENNEIIKKVQRLLDEIKNQGYFSQKRCIKKSKEPKQLGVASYEGVYDESDFINKITDSVRNYIKVMEKW